MFIGLEDVRRKRETLNTLPVTKSRVCMTVTFSKILQIIANIIIDIISQILYCQYYCRYMQYE